MRLTTDPATRAALQTFAGGVRITGVEAIPFAVSYRCPAVFASGTVTEADNVLVRVHTDAGLVGQAEAQPRPYTYGETQASIVDTVSGHLNEALTGVDPLRVELVAERCARIAGNYVARGAVDLAVWDLVGRILGAPCHTLLGGFADDVAAAHMVSFGEPAAMADEAVAVNRAARGHDLQGQGRARSGAGRRGGPRDPRGAARRRSVRRREPRLELRRRAAGRR